MPELKKFTVYGSQGRVGTLSAPARFLDSRSEKTIALDGGGELTVSSSSLQVQPDGTFFLNGYNPIAGGGKAASSVPAPIATEQSASRADPLPQPPPANAAHQTPGDTTSAPDNLISEVRSSPGEKLYREGYSIERVKIDRLVTEPVAQRQEGDTLILPVVEEVLVLEKKMLLREEIRITRSRDEVEDVITIDPSRTSS